MNCEQARQLFDAYLDGELSPALATELGAHRVQCADCRRAFALMEVSGHIIASDRDPALPRGDLAHRLVACMESQPLRRRSGLRRALYVAGPLAAAAVVALAFLGVFDQREFKVASETIKMPRPVRERSPQVPAPGSEQRVQTVDERLLQEWLERTQQNMAAQRERGQSLQEAFQLTVSQLLDLLEEARDGTVGEEHYPGAEVPAPVGPPETAPANDNDVEDL
jgi:predicted anti-sigma-YlaC factor YlaD